MTDRLLGRSPHGPESGGSAGAVPEGQGRLVGKRYRLVSPVGRGGMGMVWHAHDVLLDRDVAVKELILPFGLDHAGTQGAHRRMLREARSAARLSHPGIVTVHDVVEEDGRPWIVMELVRAWSLEQAVRQSGPLPVIQAAEIGVRVLDALRHAHAAGIMHRDVKPGNVLLTSDRVVLTDFGIAAIEGDVAITQTGLMMGSPAYVPPERLSGLPITQASDLWSFGATLYAAVEGRPPYEGPDAMAVLGAILTQEPARPSRAGALITVIEGLLRKDPAERMTAAQVAELLEVVLRSHGSGTTLAPSVAPSSPSSMPMPGDSMPMHLMPPLDVPPGPMPSRIIETPSGPIRVPYEQNVVSFEPRSSSRDALAGQVGSVGTEPLSFPGASRASRSAVPRPGETTSETFTGMSGGHLRGYDALRAPATGLGGAPSAAPVELPNDPFLSSSPFSGDPFTASPVFPGDLLGGSSAAASRGSGGGPGPASPAREASRRSARATAGSALRERPSRSSREARETREPSPFRAGTRASGRPDLRLLMLGVGGVLAIVVAGLLVFLPDGGSGTAGTEAVTAASAPAVSAAPLRAAAEVPDGFARLSAGGVSGAVPGNWTVKTGGDGAVVFSGPKRGGQNVVVVPAPVADPVTALGRASRKDLDEYTEVGVTAVGYRGWKAADWEYTYVRSDGVPMHGLTRYVAVDDRSAYQITFRAQDLGWERSVESMETFLATFTPSG
ncbi:serine/threonine-protein kinase [Streptosporangium sp. DT93]|uniref:serine/threonine-protein kinase n=1 Tax=Streptosporangium sp. DT93 TaxID=3393428 RepID=UPI003CF14F1D